MLDRRLVPLLGAFGEPLQRPLERAQEAPDMPRVILHAVSCLMTRATRGSVQRFVREPYARPRLSARRRSMSAACIGTRRLII